MRAYLTRTEARSITGCKVDCGCGVVLESERIRAWLLRVYKCMARAMECMETYVFGRYGRSVWRRLLQIARNKLTGLRRAVCASAVCNGTDCEAIHIHMGLGISSKGNSWWTMNVHWPALVISLFSHACGVVRPQDNVYIARENGCVCLWAECGMCPNTACLWSKS